MPDWIIWAIGALGYAGFLGWYQNWRGPLTPAEIDDAIQKLAQGSAGTVNSLDDIEDFLRADDGKEFIMVNLVKLHPGKVADPETGSPDRAATVLARYTGPFTKALMRRGGHPAFAARKVGPYVDAWNTPDDPGWTIAGFMRYRSRRDMVALATDPRFSAIHAFKIAAIAETYSFPSQILMGLHMSPRYWVGLALALICALVS